MGKRKARVLLMSPNLKGLIDGTNRTQPGMGIAYLAAVLRQEGHEVHVRDTALEGYDNRPVLPDGRTVLIGETDDQIAEFVRTLQPDIVGISVVFSNLADSARNIARIVKTVKPDTYTVIGGNHVTNAHRDFVYATSKGMHASPLRDVFLLDMDPANVDYAMVGESDFEFADLVDCLANGTAPHGIKNLIYRNPAGEIQMNSEPLIRTVRRRNITSLPNPAWDLFNMQRYFEIDAFGQTGEGGEKVLPVMLTRGCPELCTFCTTPDTWGMRVRWRDLNSLREEIRAALALFGTIDEIHLIDDNVTANLPGLYQLCDVMEEFGIRWRTPNGTKANYHMAQQPSYYRRMKEAGCYQITIACESGNQRVIDDVVKKKLKLSEVAKAVENAKAAGLFVHTYWIAGFPGETRDEMEESRAFAASIGADSYSFAILSPLPGTHIYREVVERDLWWPQGGGIESITYRSSLIKVDGFDGAEEFESWVGKTNLQLNQLLRKKDPERADAYDLVRDKRVAGNNIQQT